MKKRIEMIEPIQKQVFSAIEAYAKQVGADVVLDSANNPTLLYSNPSVIVRSRLSTSSKNRIIKTLTDNL